MSLLEKTLKVFDDKRDFTLEINKLFLLAITVPAILFSAISFARLGPLNTPTLFSLAKSILE